MSRVVGALATLVNIGLAARSLTLAELGVVSVFSALLPYFNFGDFGMGSVVVSRFPPAHAHNNFVAMRQIVASALSAILIVAATAMAIGIASIWFFPLASVLGAEASRFVEVRTTVLVSVVTGAVGIVGIVGSRVLGELQRGALIRVCDSIAAVARLSRSLVASCLKARSGPSFSPSFAPIHGSWLIELGYVMVAIPT